ncbi:MAG: hypothetical protein HUU45_14065 [Leptospiraceae bacterium]|nr:hypothetical protein [Leptospiraceae bacterium]
MLNVQGILDGDKIQFLDEKEHLVFPDEVGVYYEGIRIGGLSLGRNTRTTLEQVKHGLAGKKVVAEYSMSGSYIEGFIILQNQINCEWSLKNPLIAVNFEYTNAQDSEP